jgi:hypothetical protein
MIRQISGQHLVIETAEDTYKLTVCKHVPTAIQALINVYRALCKFVRSHVSSIADKSENNWSFGSYRS